MQKDKLFNYQAKLDRVIDGDTVDAMIDIGFSVYVKKRIRFYGINTPESRTRDLEEKKRGLASKDRLVDILETNDNEFYLQSLGVGKYGRCLGILFVMKLPGETEEREEFINVNKQLIVEGFGVEYFGGKR